MAEDNTTSTSGEMSPGAAPLKDATERTGDSPAGGQSEGSPLGGVMQGADEPNGDASASQAPAEQADGFSEQPVTSQTGTEPPDSSEPEHTSGSEPKTTPRAALRETGNTSQGKSGASALNPKRSDTFARFMALSALLPWVAAGALGYVVGWPAWQTYQGEQRSARDAVVTLKEQLSGVEDQLSQSVAQQLQTFEEHMATQRQALETRASTLRMGQEDALRRFDLRLDMAESQMTRLTAVDRKAWLVQEAAFLTRLASQRLLTARDSQGALTLLQQADDLLFEADSPRLDGARRALASDMMALRSIAVVDTVGLYAQLAALIELTDRLAVVAPEADIRSASAPVANDIWSRAVAGWHGALEKLSAYLIIRDRQSDLTALLNPEWQALLRQNVRMLLEQAQIALLSGNQSLYGSVLTRAQAYIETLAELDPTTAQTALNVLAELAQTTIAPPMPSLQNSRDALQGVLDSRWENDFTPGDATPEVELNPPEAL